MSTININNYKKFNLIRKNDSIHFPLPDGTNVNYIATLTERSGFNNTYWMDAPSLNNNFIFNKWGLDKMEMARISFKEHIINDEWPGAKNANDMWRLIVSIFEYIKDQIEEKPMTKKRRKKSNYDEIFNIEDIEENGLNHFDLVIFKDPINGESIRYEVNETHLRDIDRGYNDRIFDALDMDQDDVLEWAEDHYSYETDNDKSGWPIFKNGDYAALARFIRAIYEKLEDEYEDKPKKKRKKIHVDHHYNKNESFTLLLGGKALKVKIGEEYLMFSIDGTAHDHDSAFSKICKLFGLTKGGMWDLAEKSFDYKPESDVDEGSPSYINGNFDAANRFAQALMDIASGKDPNSGRSSININKKSSKDGKRVNVPRITPRIREGEKRQGHTTSGKTSEVTISVGHQRHAGISR